MAKKSGLTLTDPSALLKDMRAMGPTIAEKGGVAGVRKAATVLRRSMRGQLPKRSGRLRKSITYRRQRKGIEPGSVAFRVGLRTNQYYSVLWRGRKGYTKKSRGSYSGSDPTMTTDPIRFSIRKDSKAAFDAMIDGARRALYVEAGRVHARSKTRRRR